MYVFVIHKPLRLQRYEEFLIYANLFAKFLYFVVGEAALGEESEEFVGGIGLSLLD